MSEQAIIQSVSATLRARHLARFTCVDLRANVGYTEHEYRSPVLPGSVCIRCGHVQETRQERHEFPRPVSAQWCADCREGERCTYHRWSRFRTVTVGID